MLQNMLTCFKRSYNAITHQSSPWDKLWNRDEFFILLWSFSLWRCVFLQPPQMPRRSSGIMNTRWIWRHSTATPFTASCSSRACLSLHDWDSSPLRSAAVSLNANQSQSMSNDKRLLSCLTHTHTHAYSLKKHIRQKSILFCTLKLKTAYWICLYYWFMNRQ